MQRRAREKKHRKERFDIGMNMHLTRTRPRRWNLLALKAFIALCLARAALSVVVLHAHRPDAAAALSFSANGANVSQGLDPRCSSQTRRATIRAYARPTHRLTFATANTRYRLRMSHHPSACKTVLEPTLIAVTKSSRTRSSSIIPGTLSVQNSSGNFSVARRTSATSLSHSQ